MLRDPACQCATYPIDTVYPIEIAAKPSAIRRLATTPLVWMVVALMALLAPRSGRSAEPLKLDYVPRDGVIGLVLRPERMMKKPELDMLPREIFSAVSIRSMAVDPAQVELAVGVIGLEGWTIGQPSMGAVFYFSQPFPLNEVFAKLGLNAKAVQYEGKTYYRNRSAGAQTITASFPDERTLVFASNEAYLKKMLAAKPEEAGIHRLLRRVDLACDAAAVVDFEKLAPLIVLGLQAYPDLPPVFDEFLRLPELISTIELSAKAGKEIDLQLTLGARDAEGAAELKKLADRAKELAKEYVEKEIVPGLSAGVQGAVGPAMANYARRVTKLSLDRIEVAQQDKELSLHARVPVDVFAIGATGVLLGTAVPVGGLRAPGANLARDAAQQAQSVNNMKQIGLAMHNYHDTFNKFPPPARLDKDGKKPLLSWRVAVLPFIDQAELYKEFHLDEPWDSDHNKKLIERMPPQYRSPSQTGAKGTTVYLAADGKQSVFEGPKPVGMAAIIDGTSNTIMVVEADNDRAVVWTKPEDLKYDAEKPLNGLGQQGANLFLALFCDGSVQRVPIDINLDDLRALFTRDGKEVVNWKR